jgi:hypothetical protein
MRTFALLAIFLVVLVGWSLTTALLRRDRAARNDERDRDEGGAP